MSDLLINNTALIMSKITGLINNKYTCQWIEKEIFWDDAPNNFLSVCKKYFLKNLKILFHVKDKTMLKTSILRRLEIFGNAKWSK